MIDLSDLTVTKRDMVKVGCGGKALCGFTHMKKSPPWGCQIVDQDETDGHPFGRYEINQVCLIKV